MTPKHRAADEPWTRDQYRYRRPVFFFFFNVRIRRRSLRDVCPDSIDERRFVSEDTQPVCARIRRTIALE